MMRFGFSISKLKRSARIYENVLSIRYIVYQFDFKHVLLTTFRCTEMTGTVSLFIRNLCCGNLHLAWHHRHDYALNANGSHTYFVVYASMP